MCTVIYIPKTNGALFASCRDENPRRLPAQLPAIFPGTKTEMLYPADGHAGGTWAGVNNAAEVLILLNGGFENHERKKIYRKSRGLIMTELLDSISIFEAWEDLNLDGIEPFTLVAYKDGLLSRLVWTGDEKSSTIIDSTRPFIWSSATLYNADARALRKSWFKTFISLYPDPNILSLYSYLEHDAPKDDINGFVMNRNEQVRTCSISFIETNDLGACFSYHDLINQVSSKHALKFEAAKAVTTVPASILAITPSD